MRTILLITIVIAGLSSACSSAPIRANMAQLQSRATYDLACPAEWMRVYHLDKSTKGVSGCGNRVTYVERCESVADGLCTWVLDMKVVQVAAPAPPRGTARNDAPPHRSPSSSGTPSSLQADPLLDRY